MSLADSILLRRSSSCRRDFCRLLGGDPSSAFFDLHIVCGLSEGGPGRDASVACHRLVMAAASAVLRAALEEDEEVFIRIRSIICGGPFVIFLSTQSVREAEPVRILRAPDFSVAEVREAVRGVYSAVAGDLGEEALMEMRT